MENKHFEKILLVDDSEADNFLNSMIIEEANIAENIIICRNGIEALEYLEKKRNGEYPRPELVFLDINMPGMGGWEFLEEYEKLDKEKKAGIIICMLTTSYDDIDINKAKEYNILSGYIKKPLDEQKLMKILENVDLGAL